jgi:Fe-S oxidoreductase
MLNKDAIANIRKYGVYQDTGEARRKVLFEDIGLNADEKADYVFIAGCVQPVGMPHVFSALKNLLDKFGVSYTFLSKEYCCGWMPLGQPSVMAKNDEDIENSKELAKEFVLENFQQAKNLGAKAIVLFCGACEPTYSNYKTAGGLEVISYTELLDRFFEKGKLGINADYYAGCYRFRKKITSTSLNLDPPLNVLKKIESLRVTYLNNKLCCYIPPHLENLVNDITNRTIITICTGCYYNLQRTLKEKGDYEVKMLPEIVWEAIKDQN